MATRPTVTTISSGQIASATVTNNNNNSLVEAFDGLLGTDGTSGSNNTMTGDLDMGGNTLRNAALDGSITGFE